MFDVYLNRRHWVRIGTLSVFGAITADLRRSTFAGTGGSDEKRDVLAKADSCILIWLDGGPSHLDTFDLKPAAPQELRGPFRPIKTNVPGIEISELMPNLANQANHFAIVRSVTSPLGEHGLANHYLLTGHPPSPTLRYPSIGSVVSFLRDTSSVLPKYLSLPESVSAGAGFLPSEHDPFVVAGDLTKPDFRIQDATFYPGIDAERLRNRRTFLEALNRRANSMYREEPSSVEVHGLSNDHFDRAFEMMFNAGAREAFQLGSEPESKRARYGSRKFGQSCLLAKRLIERGVPFVTVVYSGWDTHDNLVFNLRDGFTGAMPGVGLIPTLDQGLSALIDDLSSSGRLETTLIVVMGEFGRTPKINNGGGRDHWPRVFSVAMAGGGIVGGQVVGASDRNGESPLELPVTPADLACTVFRLLGIDPVQELRTRDGRPVAINQHGKLIKPLVGA